MSAAVSLAPAIDWRTVAPEDWQYLGDLLPAPAARLSGIFPRPTPKTRPACTCSHCRALPSRARPAAKADDAPARCFVEVFETNGQKTVREVDTPEAARRAENKPSRFLEFEALNELRVLGDVDELSPGHRDVLGLGRKQAPKRASRAYFEPKADPPRVERPLTPADHNDVIARLNHLAESIGPKLHEFVGGRQDWIHEVWRELVNPPADIEQPSDLWVRVERAVGRFEKSQRNPMARYNVVDFSAASGPFSSRGKLP